MANTFVKTVTKLGQIWGINCMRKQIEQILDKHYDPAQVHEALRDTLALIPEKEVFWYTSDILDTEISEADIRHFHSYNQYVIGMLLNLAGEPDDFEFLEALKEE